jgi:cobalt/nickel transport protein
MKETKFRIIVLFVILVVAITAPFIASTNPDGLEKTAENIGVEAKTYSSLMPDYTIPWIEGKLSESFAMIAGTLLVMGASYGVFVIRKKYFEG